MAESDSADDSRYVKDIKLKCTKCKKVVTNGVQCASCEASFHHKCSGDPNIKWSCINCNDSGLPLSLQEVLYQEILRENLLLKGEHEAYKKLYEQTEAKYQNIVDRLLKIEKCISENMPNHESAVLKKLGTNDPLQRANC